jgi:hypothetical protein
MRLIRLIRVSDIAGMLMIFAACFAALALT